MLRHVSTKAEYIARLDELYQQEHREMALGHTMFDQLLSMPNRVFVSHAAVDRAVATLFADKLQVALPAAGIFVASRLGSIPPGEDWLDIIRGQLRAADIYFVICTPESIERPWVWFESGAAWMSDRRVIPVTAGTLEKGEVPMPSQANQALDLADPADAIALFGSGRGADRECGVLSQHSASGEPVYRSRGVILLSWQGKSPVHKTQLANSLDVRRW